MQEQQQPDNFSLGKLTFGWLILGLLCLLGIVTWLHFHIHEPKVSNAIIAGGVAALATAAGTLPVLFSSNISQRVQDSMLGFGAGVMLAACAFSLIIPGIDAGKALELSKWMSGVLVGISIIAGAATLFAIEHYAPHEHFIIGSHTDLEKKRSLSRTWLFVFAVALHNLPEGFAIGVSYAGTDTLQASALASGIAIQNIPEGMVVALALVAVGYHRSTAILLGVASGIIEPIGAFLGAWIFNFSQFLLPWGLGFAGGAMLFVISHEMIPESHRKGHEAYATSGLILGFVLMMLLDTSLG